MKSPISWWLSVLLFPLIFPLYQYIPKNYSHYTTNQYYSSHQHIMIIPKNFVIVIIPIYTPIIPMIFPLYHCNPKKSIIVIVSMYIPIISQWYSHGNHRSGSNRYIISMIFPYFDIPIVGLSIDIFLCFNILLECYIPMVILTNLWSYSHVIYIDTLWLWLT